MKKNKIPENYLSFIPVKSESINYSIDEEGRVTLEKENKGLFNKIAQKIFKKPRISYIHMEEIGSFIWPLIDGQTNIDTIGKSVGERFGDKAEPLYPRIAE